MVLIGLGQGLAMSPLTNQGIEGVARKDTGAASGLVNVAHQISGAIGLSLMVATSGGTASGTQVFTRSMMTATLLIAAAIATTLLVQGRGKKPHPTSPKGEEVLYRS